MKAETNGYGDSWVATGYIFARLKYILEHCKDKEMEEQLFYFLGELSHNYEKDTGKLILEEV